MILSYHPCFEADRNRLCAGRKPGTDDLAAMQEADAVILPQGCYESLYTMARSNCKHVFPNFDTKRAFTLAIFGFCPTTKRLHHEPNHSWGNSCSMFHLMNAIHIFDDSTRPNVPAEAFVLPVNIGDILKHRADPN